MADVRHALRQAPALAVGVIQDGAPEMWNLLSAALAAEPLVTKYYEAIDRYHLNERLGDILRCTEPAAAGRTDRLSQWNESLDRNDNAIYRIRESVRTAYADAITRDDRLLLEQLDPVGGEFPIVRKHPRTNPHCAGPGLNQYPRQVSLRHRERGSTQSVDTSETRSPVPIQRTGTSTRVGTGLPSSRTTSKVCPGNATLRISVALPLTTEGLTVTSDAKLASPAVSVTNLG
jgi:hypothetical protein